MDPITLGALAFQAGTGLFKAASGVIGGAKANKDARQNKRPTYYIPKPVMDNQAMAESRGSQGFSDRAMEAYRTGIQRSTSATLNSILQNGGDLNHIGDLYTAGENGVSRMAMLDDEMRARNVKNLFDQNNELAGYLDKEWTVNKYAPWADKQQEIAARKKDSQARLWSGINTLGSAAANYATANQYEKEGDQVFGPKTEGGTAMTTPVSAIDTGELSLRRLDEMLSTRPAPARTSITAPPVGQQLQSLYPGLMWGSSEKMAAESGLYQ